MTETCPKCEVPALRWSSAFQWWLCEACGSTFDKSQLKSEESERVPRQRTMRVTFEKLHGKT
jgi:ribosomal protein L37AE/L43A